MHYTFVMGCFVGQMISGIVLGLCYIYMFQIPIVISWEAVRKWHADPFNTITPFVILFVLAGAFVYGYYRDKREEAENG